MLRLRCVSMLIVCAAGSLPAEDPGMFLMGLASGTSANPASWQMPMIMRRYGDWTTVFMGTAFVSGIQQSGPRGGDKLYSTNYFMASAEHSAGAKALSRPS